MHAGAADGAQAQPESASHTDAKVTAWDQERIDGPAERSSGTRRKETRRSTGREREREEDVNLHGPPFVAAHGNIARLLWPATQHALLHRPTPFILLSDSSEAHLQGSIKNPTGSENPGNMSHDHTITSSFLTTPYLLGETYLASVPILRPSPADPRARLARPYHGDAGSITTIAPKIAHRTPPAVSVSVARVATVSAADLVPVAERSSFVFGKRPDDLQSAGGAV